MAELKCPHCGQAFTVDDAELSSIISQIRDKEFTRDLEKRIAELESSLAEKHKLQLDGLRNEVTLELKSAHDKEIEKLRKQMDALEADKVKLESEKQSLQGKIDNAEAKQELAIVKAVKEVEDGKHELERQLQTEKEKSKLLLEEKEKEVEFYKDLKAKMSTKMVGETLEQHCEIEFNKLRATAFKDAYFEKDNDARTGSKGDYIYREKDEFGNEIVSIMFEMKNEMETTATKHKNEDFFKELDKDRNEKNCEYAVLVSMLEADNELYNAGIVDVSYRYPKMYVIRPQCFIPMITLLRNAAMNALEYRQELALVRSQDADISKFEESLAQFKDDFSRNYKIAHDHFDKAIDEIDKTIQHLEKVKKELMGSDNQLRIANGKVEDVSVKRLTKDNPTMRAKFEALKK